MKESRQRDRRVDFFASDCKVDAAPRVEADPARRRRAAVVSGELVVNVAVTALMKALVTVMVMLKTVPDSVAAQL